MHDINMPKLSDTMTVGKIIKWRVAPGQAVREGEVLAEIESDKAQMELPAFRDGTVTELLRGEGDEVPVGEVIARVADPGEKPAARPVSEDRPAEAREERRAARPAAEPGFERKPPPARSPEIEGGAGRSGAASESEGEGEGRGEGSGISPYALQLARDKGVDVVKVKGTGPRGRVTARDIEAAAVAKTERSGQTPPAGQEPPAVAPGAGAGRRDEQPHAQPGQLKPAGAAGEGAGAGAGSGAGAGKLDRLARGLADKLGVRAEELPGTGTGGRVTAEDVAASAAKAGAGAREGEGAELPSLDLAPGEAEVSEASFRMRTMARRVTASARSIPHFFVTRPADVTALVGREAELRKSGGVTFTHLVMLGALRTLAKHPGVNRSYDHGRVIAWKAVNLGIAVATGEGLTVAVLRDAEKLSLGALASKSRELVERARSGKLSPEDRAHATFTVSNLGMYGVEHFQPVINPPSAVTLAVGAALEAPVVREGRVVVGRVLRLTAGCDHRIVEGAAAAEFLKDLCGLLEDPEALLAEG